jgi:hypothetical protein
VTNGSAPPPLVFYFFHFDLNACVLCLFFIRDVHRGADDAGVLHALDTARIDEGAPEPRVHPRLTNLPNVPEVTKARMPGTGDVGRLVAVAASVTRTGAVKLLERERVYKLCAFFKKKKAFFFFFSRHLR